MNEYIVVTPRSSDDRIFTIYGPEGDKLGVVSNPGDCHNSAYFGEKNWEIDLWQIEQIRNFMELGPCPDCSGYVHPEEILIHCTNCNYALCGG